MRNFTLDGFSPLHVTLGQSALDLLQSPLIGPNNTRADRA
jgi:hypothetical protein